MMTKGVQISVQLRFWRLLSPQNICFAETVQCKVRTRFLTLPASFNWTNSNVAPLSWYTIVIYILNIWPYYLPLIAMDMCMVFSLYSHLFALINLNGNASTVCMYNVLLDIRDTVIVDDAHHSTYVAPCAYSHSRLVFKWTRWFQIKA